MSKPVALTGQRFGKLIALYPTEKRFQRSIVWMCQCDCGNKKEVSARRLKSGNTKSCGCLIERRDQRYSPVFNALFATLKAVARRRDIEFKLSKDDVLELIKQDCAYCGSPPSNIFTNKKYRNGGSEKYGDLVYSGIDRVDSSKGYVADNCVPSCKRCNIAKNDMSMEEFKEWIKRLHAHFITKEAPL